jgi:XRE family transcriptional regulator, regulator of sulfur utilization
MVIGIDKVARNIAENLVSLRKKRGLTQNTLAKIAGGTRASIALIESGSSNPTLDVLLKISQALGISIDELISAPRVYCHHIKANQVPIDRRSKNGVVLRKLLPDKLAGTEIDEIQLELGSTMTGVPHVEGTREYFTCTSGEISVGVLGQMHILSKGDVLNFPGDKPHSYRNSGKAKATGISVVFFTGQLIV